MTTWTTMIGMTRTSSVWVRRWFRYPRIERIPAMKPEESGWASDQQPNHEC